MRLPCERNSTHTLLVLIAGLARCKYKTYLSTKKIDAGTVAYM